MAVTVVPLDTDSYIQLSYRLLNHKSVICFLNCLALGLSLADVSSTPGGFDQVFGLKIVCIESWTSDEEQNCIIRSAVWSFQMKSSASLTSDPRKAVSSNINLINDMSGFAIQ